MKKKINLCATVIGLLFVANTVNAQTSWLTAGNTVTSTPILGITTTTGSFPLNIQNASTTQPINFLTNGTQKATILSSGFVGIGTTTPQRRLVISNAGAEGIEINPFTGYNQIISYNRLTAGYIPLVLQDPSAGNVGVGIYNPVTKLQVNGAALFSGNTTNPTSASYIRGNSTFSTATTPDYSWWNNDQVGMFHPVSNVIGFATVGTERMRIDANGNVGINKNVPTDKLDVNGNVRINKNVLYLLDAGDVNHGLRYTGNSNPFATLNYIDGPALFGFNGGVLGTTNGGEKMALRWDYNGNVVIGNITTPGARLQVAGDNTNIIKVISVYNTTTSTENFLVKSDGKVYAREVHVVSGLFPDYVFEDSYKLKTIAELSAYIQKNKHLPGIPSAAEIKKDDGFGLGEMQIKLLEKVEEMSLYIINQQKQIDELNAIIKKLAIK